MFIHCLNFPESNTFHAPHPPPFSLYNVQCTCKHLILFINAFLKIDEKLFFLKEKQKSKRSLKVNKKKTFEFAKENVLYKYSTKPNFLIIQTTFFVYSENPLHKFGNPRHKFGNPLHKFGNPLHKFGNPRPKFGNLRLNKM